MKSLDKIKARIMREFWYWRGEALVRKLCILNNRMMKANYPAYLEHMEFIVAEKLEHADRKFWYYAARD
jgi:hypothetical protein